MTPLLLAASIFLTGATGAFLGASTPSFAITSVDELSDVNQDHWAFEALRDLVEKYDVIEGYPDGTFRGNRTPTRWEMAAALNALIKSVGRDIARLGAEKADKADLQTLARLQEQFRNELAALQARTSALEARASAIEAKNEEQDNRLTLLEKTQIHGDLTFGGLADISSQGVTNGGSNDGIRDAISTIGRLRLTLDVPLRDDKEDSKIGRTDLHTRLIAAFGRISPGAGAGGNAGQLAGFTGYSRIAGDASANNEGLFSGTIADGSNGQLRSSVYVENMHVKQHFKDGIPLLTDWFITPDSDDWETSGDLYVGQVPWRYLFDKSPYRGNENTQFQNTLFVNIPAAVNYNMPTVAYAWHQKLGSDDLTTDLTAAVSTLDQGDALGAFNATYEGRLNYKLAGLAGNLYGGGYHMWSEGNTSAIRGTGANNVQGVNLTNGQLGDPTTHAFYGGWNQEIYKGIGTTFNYLRSSGGRNNLLYNSFNPINGASVNRAGTFGSFVSLKQSLSGVLNIPMAAVVPGWRDNDAFGVGFGVSELRANSSDTSLGGVPNTRFERGWERVGEAYYRWQATEAISIIPSAQVIWNRYGLKANGTDVVIGLRTSFSF